MDAKERKRRSEFYTLWIEYLSESDFKKVHGEDAYREEVERLRSIAKTNQSLPWPAVRNLSEIIDRILDQAYSEAWTECGLAKEDKDSKKDPPFEVIRKRVLYDIKLIEETSLLLNIHPPAIPRGGINEILEEVRRRIREKRDLGIDDFYTPGHHPDGRVIKELGLYLTIYRGKKQGLNENQLMEPAKDWAEHNKDFSSKDKDPYIDQSQIRRFVMYARRILKNVEQGRFPGHYRDGDSD